MTVLYRMIMLALLLSIAASSVHTALFARLTAQASQSAAESLDTIAKAVDRLP